MRICMHVRMYACAYVCMRVCMHVHMYACAHESNLCMHGCAYIYSGDGNNVHKEKLQYAQHDSSSKNTNNLNGKEK